MFLYVLALSMPEHALLHAVQTALLYVGKHVKEDIWLSAGVSKCSQAHECDCVCAHMLGIVG